MEETKQQRLLSPLLLIFIGTMILANIAAQMIMPLESLYVQKLGASIEQIGIFFTVASIAPLFLQVFGGWLSDSAGRLKAIAIGSVGGALSYLFYIFAPSWIWLLPSTVLTAMAVAFVSPSFQAFIAEESTPETRGRVYGITSTMYMVVNIIGPILGGTIAQGFSFRAMYVIAACLYITAAVIRILMARHAGRKKEKSRGTTSRPGLSGFKKSLAAVFGLLTAGGVVTWIFISDGVRDVSFSLTGRLMPLYLENKVGISLLEIGSLQSIAAIVAMVLMTPAGWLSDKKGERVGIVGGFGLSALSWFIFLNSGNYQHLVVSRVVGGMGWALIGPAYSSLISKAVPNELRGTAFGLFSTSLGLISLPAPWIGARLWEAVNPLFPFYIPLVSLLAMLPIMWVKFKLPPDAEGGEEAPAIEVADASPATT
jgi:MFS family permease